MDHITQVTDEMLIHSFQTHEKLGLIVAFVSIVLFLVFLVITRRLIKKSKANDANANINADKKINDRKFGLCMMGLLVLLMLSLAGVRVGVAEFWSNYRAEKKGYTVSLEIVQGKIKKRKHRGTVTSPNYMIFSSLGKQEVSDKYYKEFHENDIVYVVFSADGNVMKVLNTTEYMYVGEYSSLRKDSRLNEL